MGTSLPSRARLAPRWRPKAACFLLRPAPCPAATEGPAGSQARPSHSCSPSPENTSAPGAPAPTAPLPLRCTPTMRCCNRTTPLAYSSVRGSLRTVLTPRLTSLFSAGKLAQLPAKFSPQNVTWLIFNYPKLDRGQAASLGPILGKWRLQGAREKKKKHLYSGNLAGLPDNGLTWEPSLPKLSASCLPYKRGGLVSDISPHASDTFVEGWHILRSQPSSSIRSQSSITIKININRRLSCPFLS